MFKKNELLEFPLTLIFELMFFVFIHVLKQFTLVNICSIIWFKFFFVNVRFVLVYINVIRNCLFHILIYIIFT